MTKACLFFAFFLGLVLGLPLRAFDWQTATSRGREYVTLQSFCAFYGLGYRDPGSNNTFDARNAQHTVHFKVGSPDILLDGVHYVMSFPVENGDHDWLVSRMDVIKLFEPVLRPTEISDRHTIRGVVLDAGHGGSDNGAVSSRGGMEKTYTRDTVNRLEAILRAAGLKTVLTRRSDVFVDLYERAHIASLYPDYCFVSIHFNSATPEARGLETYCLSPRGAASTSSRYLSRSDIQKLPGNGDDATNILLASLVHSEIIRLNPGDGTADRGVKRARFVVIKQNVLPAILVEGGFVSNRMEAARVNQPEYRQSLAEAVARGVIRFVNVMGNKRMSLPGATPALAPVAPPPPRVTPTSLPPAPSGLASDPAQKADKTTLGKATVAKPAVNTSIPPAKPKTALASAKTKPVPAAGKTSSTNKSKQAKGVKTVKAGQTTSPDTTALSPKPSATDDTAPVVSGDSGLTNQAPVTPAPPPNTPTSPADTPSGPLNLSEPATPAPSPGAEKAPPEPDEPPTVNIYPTTPAKSSGSAHPPTTNAAPVEPADP